MDSLQQLTSSTEQWIMEPGEVHHERIRYGYTACSIIGCGCLMFNGTGTNELCPCGHWYTDHGGAPS